ncbi:hypothetical protein [Cellulomonas telluris]|uniref:hypothetical protein n=1 Tax=Cellulomonas telluris TaxID=2306636 RepID=UPI0010A85056|nr:hypothetical protein [Cellulomonas telluris]
MCHDPARSKGPDRIDLRIRGPSSFPTRHLLPTFALGGRLGSRLLDRLIDDDAGVRGDVDPLRVNRVDLDAAAPMLTVTGPVVRADGVPIRPSKPESDSSRRTITSPYSATHPDPPVVSQDRCGEGLPDT